MLAAADGLKKYKEVLFAWPNSVAQYLRANTAATAPLDWWLARIGAVANGMRLIDKGDPNVLIAVLDDGVDIEHPNLANRMAADPGKDYAIPVGQPGHDNPRPKIKVASKKESDYHGTACAGLICSDGHVQNHFGVAPGCKLVSVRVVNGPALISDHSVAEAIRYATKVAHVISCSWNGTYHQDVAQALNDTKDGRNGKGVAVFGSAGNYGGYVAFPATHGRVIAVGSCDYEDAQTDYSNFGNELSVVTPSSNGVKVFTTDCSQEYWGFNPGAAGDPDGLFHSGFGGTSASAAIAAGVGALCFSANPNLTADELRSVLQDTAGKIGGEDFYGPQTGHGPIFGYGCIHAAAAVAVAKCML
jgi:subtilisin family serine protease